MEPIFIAGVFTTPFAKRADASVKQLTVEAVNGVLADAGIAAPSIQVGYFANAFQSFVEGQTNIPGQIALRAAGLHTIPVVNVENACASGSTAMWLAMQALRAGAADVALAIGVEKMNYGVPELDARVMEAFRGGMDIHDLQATLQRIEALCGVEPADRGGEGRRTAFMDLYAARCRAHMKRFGTTQRQIAAIAVKNHMHSVHNPNAHYRKAFTIEEVLASRALGYPLTVLMCSPLSDGAAAAVLCTAQGARRLGLKADVRIRACELVSSVDRAWDDLNSSGVHQAAHRAYEVAGVGPEDIDFAEVHDATAWGELHVMEKLGLCRPGEAGRLAEEGVTSIGGRFPVNPSGGLECRGHPIGATGLAQVHELVTQLRGRAGPRQIEGARLALQENGGGFLGVEEGAVVVSILEKAEQ